MHQKTALVTGGTAGVGLSMVRALVQTGAHVHFIGTRRENGQRIEQELNGTSKARCVFVELDLSRLRDVQAFATDFASAVPRLDILANVAGVILPRRQQTDEGFEKTLAIGHLAPFVLSRTLSPSLASAPHGRIVNVSGRPSLILKPRLEFQDLQLQDGYSMTKAALNAVHAKTVMTQILAEQFASHGIDVNAFHPGAVKSNLLRHLPFPLNLAGGVAGVFMPNASRSGNYTATSEALNGVTGQLIVDTTPQALSFEQSYRDRLLAATERMVAQTLATW